MPIEAVIWDMGGVLVRTLDRSLRVQWEGQLDLQQGELDRLVFEGAAGRAAAMGKASAEDIWREIQDRFDLTTEQTKQLEKDFWAGDQVDKQLIAAIRELRPRYRTALLSNAWPDLRHALENIWKIADAFDDIVISAEVGIAKPDPRIYELALTRLAIPPERALFIDDFQVNIDAAAALGIQTIHFVNPETVNARLAQLLEIPSKRDGS